MKFLARMLTVLMILTMVLGSSFIAVGAASDEIPVPSDPQVPAGAILVDDADEGTDVNQIEFSKYDWGDSMWGAQEVSPFSYHNNFKGTNEKSATITFRFEGTSVQMYGVRAKYFGQGYVSIDDGPKTLVEFYADTADDLNQQLIYKATNLSEGQHTLVLTNANKVNPKQTFNTEASNVNVDYFLVGTAKKMANPAGLALPKAEKGTMIIDDLNAGTRPGLMNQIYYSRLPWYGPDWAAKDTTLDAGLVGGTKHTIRDIAFIVGDIPYASLKFMGTKVTLYGVKGPEYGQATINLDGEESTVDYYAAETENHAVIFESDELVNTVHNISITYTGAANEAATGNNINIDNFVIQKASFVPAVPVDSSSNVKIIKATDLGSGVNQMEVSKYDWGDPMMGGFDANPFFTYLSTNENAAYVNIRFEGTQAQVYGVKAPYYGMGLISVDGGEPVEVSYYAEVEDELPNQLLYTTPVLAEGVHTITVKNAGKVDPEQTHNTEVSNFDVQFVAVTNGAEYTPKGPWLPEKAKAPAGSIYVDDLDAGTGLNQIHYSRLPWYGPDWIAKKVDKGCFGGTKHDIRDIAFIVGDVPSAEMKFEGTKVALYAMTGTDQGIAGISIDGGEAQQVDLYSASKKYKVKVFESDELTAGEHTVTVTFTGTMNEKSANNFINIDYFEITK